MLPSMEENAADGMFCIRKSLETKGVLEEARRISQRNQSWRESTRSQFGVCLKKWTTFRSERNIGSRDISVNNVVEFLTTFYASGLGYSSIYIAPDLSYLHLIVVALVQLEKSLICRFMRGVYFSRPTQSRYTAVWDV